MISDPTWLSDFYDPSRVGGPLIDLHVHDAHLIRFLFGMPTHVVSSGRQRDSVVEYCNTLFEFEDPDLVVSSVCGVIPQQGRPFTHGFELHLEKATLQFELAVNSDEVDAIPYKILHQDGTVERPDLGGGDDIAGFVREIEEVNNAIESGQPSAILSGVLARDAIALCQAQSDSVRGRTKIAIA